VWEIHWINAIGSCRDCIPGVQELRAKMRCPVGALGRRQSGEAESDRLFSTSLERAEELCGKFIG
jgi:hypothetical protein